MTTFKKIAFLGLGKMGTPMAQNVARAGLPLVVYDVSSAARGAAAEVGLSTCDTISEALLGADLVVTMLPNGKIVRDALTSGDVHRHCAEGAILLEMSSSAPTDTRALTELLSGHLRMVDAPVSGGVKRAVEGTLAVMVGGASEDQARVRPVLEAMASIIFDCGPVGAGHAMKSINNFVSGAGVIAASEAIKLGTAFGLKAETIADVLNASSGKNNATDVKLKQFMLSGTFASGFALGLMAKDIGIAAALGEDLGLSLDMLKRTADMWNQATEVIGGAEDHTRMFDFVAQS